MQHFYMCSSLTIKKALHPLLPPSLWNSSDLEVRDFGHKPSTYNTLLSPKLAKGLLRISRANPFSLSWKQSGKAYSAAKLCWGKLVDLRPLQAQPLEKLRFFTMHRGGLGVEEGASYCSGTQAQSRRGWRQNIPLSVYTGAVSVDLSARISRLHGDRIRDLT